MRIRKGFVSNSSSSSFIVRKAYLSEEEIDRILHHYEEYPDWPWKILDKGSVLIGYTQMDNFDMKEFVESFVKVPYAFCWIYNQGWAWTSLFKDLDGKSDLIQFLSDPDNTSEKPCRKSWIKNTKELW